jgi:ubiquinol-cytochrome c reductase cytochrome b subunit
VQNKTLKKFAALHFCIPFLILGIIFLHLVCLHEAGSSNMLSHGGAIRETEFLDFFSYFIKKDLVIFSLVLIVFLYFVCLRPNFFSSIHTHVPADPLVGIYVVPEWYFLPLFGFIKCVRSKIMGVCLLSFFFVLLLFLPLSNSLDNLNTHFSISGYFVYRFLVVNLFTSFVCLGLVASKPLTESIFIFSGYLSL